MTTQETSRKIPRLLLEAILALALAGVGVYGLSIVLQQRPYTGQAATTLLQVPLRVLAGPNLPALGLFMLALAGVITGAAGFILRLIHQVFFRPVRSIRVWREAVLVAVYLVCLAWLQLNQAFSLVLAAVIAAALILLEIFLNIRVRDE